MIFIGTSSSSSSRVLMIPQATKERSEAELRQKKKKVERILIWIYDIHCLSDSSAYVQIWTFSPQVIISRQFF